MRYFEDFPVGMVHENIVPGLSEEEIITFAQEWDPQGFHVDPEAAKETIFGELIASGFHSLLLMFRVMLQDFLLDTPSNGSPGMQNIKWVKPLRPHQPMRVVMQVANARVSESRPSLGLIFWKMQAFEVESGDLLTEYESISLIKRRGALAT